MKCNNTAQWLTWLMIAGSLIHQVQGLETLDDMQCFVQVSQQDSRYFELSNGSPYVPIGLNMIAPWGQDEADALSRMDQWMNQLSENGGNYIRLWLSHDFFDIEHEQCGVYDEAKAKRIDAVLAMARKYHIRVKMTLEHFRHFLGEQQRWAAKPLYHVSRGGPARDMDDFFQGQASQALFKKKLDWYAHRYGSDPTIFAWELWNEIDAVQGRQYQAWTELMLTELKKRFPQNLVTQSLGSFDWANKTDRYRTFCRMPNNDIANVHRYLDLGASLDECKGPVDVMAASAVKTLRSFNLTKPIVLAESGAVEPSHSGPFKLYKTDNAGIILHDVIFAPFFSGAAGTGQCWHWDQYVADRALWFQFRQFSQAIQGINPLTEHFKPIEFETPRLRVYALQGRHTLLIWCRDKQNTWQTELAQGLPPELIHQASLTLPATIQASQTSRSIRFYDPWTDTWTDGQFSDTKIQLPDFKRSLVIRVEY
ncbi:MAG: cellulase family glycosylhydrolase [Phycisphaerae bacterium]|nr:cellulase family glycosylhydrolase [Phycisphaerae bacterium]